MIYDTITTNHKSPIAFLIPISIPNNAYEISESQETTDIDYEAGLRVAG